jgi:hypothetical protein
LICGTPTVKRLEAGITIGLPEARKVPEVPRRMLAAAISVLGNRSAAAYLA